MAKLSVGDGLETYIKQLEQLEGKTDGILKRSVYEGARVMLDAIDSRIDGIPSHVANEKQKQALHNGLGSSKMKSGGVSSWSNKVGFDGYYDGGYKNNSWNAIPFLANRIQSGTSHTDGYAFVSMATNASKSQAEKAMQDSIEKDIQNLMK